MIMSAAAIYVPDDAFTAWCRDLILRAVAGEVGADGRLAATDEPYEYGFRSWKIRAFSRAGIDVWLYRDGDPCNCRSWHVEFGRTGGEMLAAGEEDDDA